MSVSVPVPKPWSAADERAALVAQAAEYMALAQEALDRAKLLDELGDLPLEGLPL